MGVLKKTTRPRVIAGNCERAEEERPLHAARPAQPLNEGRQRLNVNTSIAFTYSQPQQPPLTPLTPLTSLLRLHAEASEECQS